jgi:group I intron endonuclease
MSSSYSLYFPTPFKVIEVSFINAVADLLLVPKLTAMHYLHDCNKSDSINSIKPLKTQINQWWKEVGTKRMTEKPGIYSITHIATGKIYVGSASNISKRWHRHRKDLRLGIHRNKHLQAAWTKYGEDAFVFNILELTTELDTQEQFWMDHTGCTDPEKGYNNCPTARSSRGFKRGPESEEQRKRKSLYLKGKCGCGITSPIRQGAANNQSKLTDETVREMRALYGETTLYGKSRKRGNISYQQLADKYGVSLSVAYEAVRGITWKHVK